MSSCRIAHWLIGSQIQTPFPQVPALQLYQSGASAAAAAVVVVVEADDASLAAVVEPVLGVAQEQAAKVEVLLNREWQDHREAREELASRLAAHRIRLGF